MKKKTAFKKGEQVRKSIDLPGEVSLELDKEAKTRRLLSKPYIESLLISKVGWEFKKGDKIKVKAGNHVCVCADHEYAIFAPFSGVNTSFKNLFAFSNEKGITDASNYERI